MPITPISSSLPPSDPRKAVQQKFEKLFEQLMTCYQKFMSTGNGKYYDEIIPIEKELGELFGKNSGDLTSEQFTAYNNWAYANSFVSRNTPKDSPRLRDA